eukprot:CAMPEP_0172610326 /NCGR_PEP_ID=MMETSP1068-20121228/30149_1 /TAXON_ID=35684 /ORGANISM="Pseudopedinella elastica, Strain CCMP716" /LENGTH=33 /DNA_ID= /DNA_START= /DNA_END= /DNA_ORIENTATION=
MTLPLSTTKRNLLGTPGDVSLTRLRHGDFSFTV